MLAYVKEVNIYLEMLEAVCSVVNVPVIASGGLKQS